MANNDDEAGWDSLVDELGLDEKAKPAPAPVPPVAEDDFGGDVVSEEQGGVALYDPGPDAVADDEDDGEDDGPEGSGDGAPGSEGDGTGKKKRRRRRRRKKKGPDGAPEATAAGVPAEGSQVVVVAEAADIDGVEQGDAPGEIEGGDDDEDDRVHSAVDDEMDEEAAAPRREWQVMTWNELVGKLYRPN